MNPKIYENTNTQKNKNKFFNVTTAISIPALVILFLFCIKPFIWSLLVSFKKLNFQLGLVNSPWVGLENFKQLFQSPNTLRIIQNTVVISISSIIIGGIYVFLLTYGIASIKKIWLKIVVTSLAILPTLIPVTILIKAYINTDILNQPSLYILSAIGNEVFCIAPIAVLAGTFACIGKFDIKKVWFIALGYTAVRFMLVFSSDYNYLINSYNPNTYSTGDVISTYIYRHGFFDMELSNASAIYITKILLSLIPLIIGIIAVILMSGKMQGGIEQNVEKKESKNLGMLAVALVIIPALIFIWVSTKTISGINIFTNALIIRGLLNSLILSGIGCVLAAIFSLCLSYAMASDNKVILILTSIFMLLGDNIIGQYYQMHSLNFDNTYIPIMIIYSLYACIGAYFIYFAVGGISKGSFIEFFKKSYPILIAILGIGFARFYGSIIEPLIYISNRAFYPVSLILREITISGMVDKIDVSTILLLLIPVIIGISSITVAIILAAKLNNAKNLK